MTPVLDLPRDLPAADVSSPTADIPLPAADVSFPSADVSPATASDAVLAAVGRPSSPRELLGHDVVGLTVGVLLGGLALHVASVATYHDASVSPTADRAVVTALLGAAVWSVLSSVPYVGLALALVGWVGLVHLRYPGRPAQTGVLAVVAVAGASVVGLVLATVDVTTVPVLGVPSLSAWTPLG